MMANYFSVGVDARIGFGFDKKRTKTRCCNKCMYVWEGLKKLCCMPISRAQDFLTEIYLQKEDSQGTKQIIVSTQQGNQPQFQGRPITILALNINSYAGGQQNIWRNCANRSATNENQGNYGDQKVGDGKIELITFNSAINLLAEAVIKGQGRRLCQTEGPLVYTFREPESGRRP